MRRYHLVLGCWFGLLSLSGCESRTGTTLPQSGSWQQSVQQIIPRLGHRNWLVITDKAYPYQTSAGVEYIQADAKLLPVLTYVLDQFSHAGHVTPVVFCDQELGYITPAQIPAIDAFRTDLSKLLKPYSVKSIPHDSVFGRLASTAEQFKVVIIKTEETTAYSSVFMQLDCTYWGPAQEAILRKAVAGKSGRQ